MKKLITITIYFILINNFYSQNPTWLWASGAGGPLSEEGTSIAIDSSGNCYVTGFFTSNNCTFGSTVLSNVSFSDVFIAKYDASANLLWAKSAGGLGEDKGKAIAVDLSGNTYVTGVFNSSTITFDTISITASTNNDIFIAKYNSDGNILWVKKINGTGGDFSTGLYIDENGNCFISGYFSGSSIQFGNTTLLNQNSSFGGLNYFVAKLDSAGNHIWAKAAVSGNVIGNSVKVNHNGNIFVTGNFSGTTTFDTITKISNGSKDVFVAKYDSLGNAIWVKSVGGSNEENANDIGVDKFGNCYITGYFKSINFTVNGTTITNSGAPDGDMITLKYDSLGNLIWIKKAFNYSNDLGLKIAVDDVGNSYVGGYYNGSSVNFTGGVSINSNFSTTNIGDFYVVKYNASGVPQWAKNLQSPLGARCGGIASDNSGNCFVTGYYVDPTLAFDNITLISYGNSTYNDVFVGKIGFSTTVNINEISKLKDLKVFPNPAINYIEVNAPLNTQIEIINSLGDCIFKTNTCTLVSTIDVRLFAKGIYFLKSVDENNTCTIQKIIIQ
jgi:hypothetical protein